MTHRLVSYIKSTVRFVGFLLLATADFKSAALALTIAEIIGMYEELTPDA